MLKGSAPFSFLMLIEDIQDKKWQQLRYEASCVRVAQAFSAFRDAGVEPVLIKGWAVARHYPDPALRAFSDIDLCVQNIDSGRARALLEKLDLGAAIDLHDGLRHLDSVSWDTLLSRSALVPLNGVDVRVLCDEDHLRVLITHWLNDGGAKPERLDDLFYTITASEREFNWELALRNVPSHRRGWIAKAVSAGMIYRGHSYSRLPFSEDELTLPRWFTEALEKEWTSEPLYPLYYLLGNPRRFFRQLFRRFPPNPIQATIESDAPIDEAPRLGLQLRTFVRRIPMGIRMQLRVLRSIFR